MKLTWFEWSKRWHMQQVRDGDMVSTKCGAVFEVEGPGITVDCAEMPPTPCRNCLFEWANEVSVPETMDVALGRGYEPAPVE